MEYTNFGKAGVRVSRLALGMGMRGQNDASEAQRAPDLNLRDTGRAVELAERAAGLTGYRDARVLNTLAFAYASADRLEEALETAGTALELASVANDIEMAQHLREQIARYRRGEL